MSDGQTEEPIPFEAHAREVVRWIEDRIKVALSATAAKNVTPEDRIALERALEDLRPSFDWLDAWLLDPVRENKPNTCAAAYLRLYSLMRACFDAGMRGMVSTSARKATKSIEQRTSAKSQVKADRQEKLVSFLLKNDYEEPWPMSTDFAEQIRPEFLKCIGVRETRGRDGSGYNTVTPTIETLKKDIQEVNQRRSV